jgi:hypothetical protein
MSGAIEVTDDPAYKNRTLATSPRSAAREVRRNTILL